MKERILSFPVLCQTKNNTDAVHSVLFFLPIVIKSMPLKWKAYSVVFLYMCLTLFTFIYGTEQILFRHDPWEIVKQLEKSNPNMNENSPMESGQSASSTDSNAAFRATLEQWMQSKKPYLNPDFRLLDLGQVLPLNRTYLSHFIHSEYDCTFYQFVNRYRIEEAKRMKMENPEMKKSKYWVKETKTRFLFMKKPQCYDVCSEQLSTPAKDEMPYRLTIVYFYKGYLVW